MTSPGAEVTAAPRFTTIKEFIEEAISGRHTAEEITEILDVIEQGIGLQEADRSFAQAFEDLPKRDDLDPVWQRGHMVGADAVIDLLAPMLRRIEWRGRRKAGTRLYTCPNCRRAGKHGDDCELSQFLRAIDNGKPLVRPASVEPDIQPLKGFVQLEAEHDPAAPLSVFGRLEALHDEGLISDADAAKLVGDEGGGDPPS